MACLFVRRRRLGAVLLLIAVLSIASPSSASSAAGPMAARAGSLPGLRVRVAGLARKLGALHRSIDGRRARVRRLRRRRAHLPQLLRQRLRTTTTPLPPAIREVGSAANERVRSAVDVASLRTSRRRIPHAIAWQRRSLRRLRGRTQRLETRLWQLRPIGTCPVRRPVAISDDFGAPRFDHGLYHAHQGNDISAPFGSAIVAPFDGHAVAVANDLGGLAVDVYGAAGHVYNAHLSRLGRLGRVAMGTVIGYVGESGNATSPHDHFEWHPLNGPAIDPHVLLTSVCDL